MKWLLAVALCLPIPTDNVDVAIWRENGDHIFIVGGVEHNVGGECYNIEKEHKAVHRYTWINRMGMFVVSRVNKIFLELDGELIPVEEY